MAFVFKSSKLSTNIISGFSICSIRLIFISVLLGTWLVLMNGWVVWRTVSLAELFTLFLCTATVFSCSDGKARNMVSLSRKSMQTIRSKLRTRISTKNINIYNYWLYCIIGQRLVTKRFRRIHNGRHIDHIFLFSHTGFYTLLPIFAA